MRIVWRDVLRMLECCFEYGFCCLKVVLCFEVLSRVALRVVLKVVLRLYGMLL